jgi:hypothetical protein
VEAFCNLGYANLCAWAPAERNWDAIRFAVTAPCEASRDQETNSVRILNLRYICEKANRPADHGELEFDLSGSFWIRPHSDARIQKMAECFLDSYLRRKS